MHQKTLQKKHLSNILLKPTNNNLAFQ